MKNLKGGRPKLAESEKRNHAFTVRFTDGELEQLEDSAGVLPLREYIRSAALKKRLPVGTKKADPALLKELRRIGANINQLARNSYRTGVHPKDLLVPLEELKEYLRNDK